MTNEQFEQIMGDVKKVRIGGLDVVIDPSNLQFTDATLTRYFDREATWYDYFGRRLVEAEAESQHFDAKFDVLYASKFAAIKQEEGCSDKLAESKAKCDPEVCAARDHAILADAKAKMIKQHLKSWDKAHENAKNRNYTLCKEMERLQRGASSDDIDVNHQIEDIISKSTAEEE